MHPRGYKCTPYPENTKDNQKNRVAICTAVSACSIPAAMACENADIHRQNSHIRMKARAPRSLEVNSGSPFRHRPVGKYHTIKTRTAAIVCQKSSTRILAERNTVHECDLARLSRDSYRDRLSKNRGITCWSTVLKSMESRKIEKTMLVTPCKSSGVLVKDSPLNKAWYECHDVSICTWVLKGITPGFGVYDSRQVMLSGQCGKRNVYVRALCIEPFWSTCKLDPSNTRDKPVS